MKLPEIAVALGLSALSVLSSCRDNNLSLDDVHGGYFPFRSQITAIRDVPGNSDSILLATDDGEIMFFDTKRISRSTLSSTGCETIYDMTIHDGCLYYAVRDGGIGKVSLRGDGKPERGAEEWFRINEIKGTQYSPYGILLSEDGKTIYGATSNGIYRWETDRTDICGIPLHPSGDDAQRRFYSVTRRGDVTQNHGTNQHRDVIFFGGDEGVLKLTLQNLKVLTERIYDESVTALNGRFQLSGNRLTEIGGGQNKAGSYSVSFNRKPRNFVVNGGYAYAVSQRAVECADISSGRIVAVIELPEKRLSRPRNKSCRAICLIKNSFLYVAPGGNRLYRIPLAPYLKSEEIISVCQGGENEIYALSESNDLYSVQLRKESDGVIRFENPEYVRTVMKGEAISLAGACGDTVFVSSGDSICGLIGKRRIVGISTDRNDKITCNLFVGTSLYQGKHDMVRVYDYSKTIEKPREIKKYESGPWLRGKDGIKDYYPTKLCMAGDRLVIGTLHNGVYYVDKNMSEPVCLIDASPALRVLDISPADSAAFVLTADTLYSFVFAEECCRRSRWNIPEFGNESGKFNRILPVSEDRIYLFSDGYDFGAYEFILDSDGKWRHRGTVGESALLCDALSFGTAGIPVFCGSDGLSTDSSFAAVHRPSLYAVRKIDAETYWYGRAVFCGSAFVSGAYRRFIHNI